MTPEQFEAEMKAIVAKYSAGSDNGDDKEARHRHMDNLLLDTLTELGYGAGVEVFRKTAMWYA